MKIEIELHCPRCQSTSIKKNGIKSDAKQSYRCKSCGRQFVGDHNLTYLGCHSLVTKRVSIGCNMSMIEVAEKLSLSYGVEEMLLQHKD